MIWGMTCARERSIRLLFVESVSVIEFWTQNVRSKIISNWFSGLGQCSLLDIRPRDCKQRHTCYAKIDSRSVADILAGYDRAYAYQERLGDDIIFLISKDRQFVGFKDLEDGNLGDMNMVELYLVPHKVVLSDKLSQSRDLDEEPEAARI